MQNRIGVDLQHHKRNWITDSCLTETVAFQFASIYHPHRNLAGDEPNILVVSYCDQIFVNLQALFYRIANVLVEYGGTPGPQCISKNAYFLSKFFHPGELLPSGDIVVQNQRYQVKVADHAGQLLPAHDFVGQMRN